MFRRKNFAFRNLLAALILTSLLSTLPVAAQPAGARLDDLDTIVAIGVDPGDKALTALDASFYDYQVFELGLDQVAAQVREHGALRVHFGNRTFDLLLELNDLRAPGFRAELTGADGRTIQVDPPVATYKGRVAGDPESIVRITVLPDLFEGYVKTDHEWLFIDPLMDFTDDRDPSRLVVYRDVDVRPDDTKTCGAEHLEATARRFGVLDFIGKLNTPGAPGAKALRRFDVATESDGQYFNAYGNPGIFNRMSSALNGVDGIYRAELDLDLNLVYQHGWSSASGDPYTSFDAGVTLNEFRNWWNANRSSINRDVAHLFSGKNFNGSTIGIAWVGVVCNAPSYAYGLSEDQSSSSMRIQLAAHEIGHNFSAGHDNQTPVCSGVNCNGFGPIMCSFIQTSGTNSFSSCSVSSINSHTASNGSCLN